MTSCLVFYVQCWLTIVHSFFIMFYVHLFKSFRQLLIIKFYNQQTESEAKSLQTQLCLDTNTACAAPQWKLGLKPKWNDIKSDFNEFNLRRWSMYIDYFAKRWKMLRFICLLDQLFVVLLKIQFLCWCLPNAANDPWEETIESKRKTLKWKLKNLRFGF